MINLNEISAALATCGCEVSESVQRSGHPPRFTPVPLDIDPALMSSLIKNFPSGLYSHQSEAIQTGIGGKSLCIATPTASGKTLVFTSVVLDRLLKHPGDRAMVLYPAKALIQDQLGKWKQAVTGTGLTVDFIDGSVDTALRRQILQKSDVLLMTPDILHAWFMSNQEQPEIRAFSKKVSLLVMDETHVYEGVFGTNMAYLLRRLRAVSSVKQVIASTATIGEPGQFLRRLIGIDFEVFDATRDGSGAPDKTFCHASVPVRRISQVLRSVIKLFEGRTGDRFLVFADSRKRVEELVSDGISNPRAGSSEEKKGDEAEASEGTELDQDDLNTVMVELYKNQVLPYRAGYEEDDRLRIQKALSGGDLKGVVATSALELGIDIGEISLVVLVGVAPSVKSFWQRAGRTARRGAGTVLILDTSERIQQGRLNQYLEQSVEQNWLYLDNDYLQYANVLCAADEFAAIPAEDINRQPLDDLPLSFQELLENELNPTEQVRTDLYALKQAAGASKPHFAFPVRSGIERQYKVLCPKQPGRVFGNLTYSQLMNEAFPGAIYRYMAQPFRVYQIMHPKGEIKTNAMKGIGKTSAIKIARTFPVFGEGTRSLFKSDKAFFAETEVQVSERVTGFVEHWGPNKTEHAYGPTSTYSQKALGRYFDSTGCCLYVSEIEYSKEKVARYVAMAFCRVCSVHERDIGHGVFSSKKHPIGEDQISGVAIYDAVQGSLRLTQFLIPNIIPILQQAIQIATHEGALNVAASIAEIADLIPECREVSMSNTSGMNGPLDTGDGWRTVVRAGERAAYHDGTGHIDEEVEVLRYFFTPSGLNYELRHRNKDTKWHVAHSFIKPIPGETEVEEYNINTGEVRTA